MVGRRWRRAVLAAGLGLACRPAVPSDGPAPSPVVVATYDPSPMDVVEVMLSLAEIAPGETVVDLGSGDGRLVIEAARRYEAEAIGVEIDPELVSRARRAIAQAGLQSHARIVEGDLHTYPLAGVDVLTLFLWPSENLRLRPKILADMSLGARVVSHDHDMGDWEADVVTEVDTEQVQRRYEEPSPVYLWIVPADFSGCWSEPGGDVTLEIHQRHQVLRAQMRRSGARWRLGVAKARGRRATLVARVSETERAPGAQEPEEIELRVVPSGLELHRDSLGTRTLVRCSAAARPSSQGSG